MKYFTPAPDWYKCEQCGATNCRLWRPYQSTGAQLYCFECAKVDQVEELKTVRSFNRPPTPPYRELGWLVLAVPTEEAIDAHKVYWGYTSVPQAGILWWENLPLTNVEKRWENHP